MSSGGPIGLRTSMAASIGPAPPRPVAVQALHGGAQCRGVHCGTPVHDRENAGVDSGRAAVAADRQCNDMAALPEQSVSASWSEWSGRAWRRRAGGRLPM